MPILRPPPRIANGVAASLSNVVEKSLYTAGSNSAVKLSIVQPAQVPHEAELPEVESQHSGRRARWFDYWHIGGIAEGCAFQENPGRE